MAPAEFDDLASILNRSFGFASSIEFGRISLGKAVGVTGGNGHSITSLVDALPKQVLPPREILEAANRLDKHYIPAP